MRLLKTVGLFIFVFIVNSACSELAQAAAIANLSPQVRRIEIKTARGFQPEDIEPGRTWRLAGRVTVRYDGEEYDIDQTEEYAIWNDGVLGPQKRISSHTNSSVLR